MLNLDGGDPVDTAMTSPKYYILGDSHVAAFLAGARQAGGGNIVSGGGWGAATVYFEPFFEIVNGRIVPFEDRVFYRLWKRTTGVDMNDCEGRLILSMGLATVPAIARPTWRTFGPDHAPISRTLLNTIVNDFQEYVLRFYDALIERGLLAAVYDPPPPSSSHPALVRSSRAITDIVAERYRFPVLERIERAGLPVIRLPVVGDDGFIDPHYAGPDPAHAGPAIGPHVVAALQALQRQG